MGKRFTRFVEWIVDILRFDFFLYQIAGQHRTHRIQF